MRPSVKFVAVVWVSAVAALGSTGIAAAAPSGPMNAAQTVNALQADGFRVIVNRVGAGPLDRCAVDGVRQGQIFERTDSGAPGAGSSIVTTVEAKTVYVDVVC